MALPMPGEQAYGRTVIASAYYAEHPYVDVEEYVILALNPQAPYYSVITARADMPNIPLNVDYAVNIHNATELYRDWGGE